MSQSRALTRGLSFGLSKAIARPEGVGVAVNTVAPVAPSGTYAEGQTLTASQGTWTGATSYAYQWYSATGLVDAYDRFLTDGNGNILYTGASVIVGATSSTYLLTASDVGADKVVFCTVTASPGAIAISSPVAGPVERVSNPGAPYSATTGYSVSGGTVALSVVANKLRLTSTSSAASNRVAVITVSGLIIGAPYKVLSEASGLVGPGGQTAPAAAVVRNAADNGNLATLSAPSTAGGAISGTFTPTATSHNVRLQWSSDALVDITSSVDFTFLSVKPD